MVFHENAPTMIMDPDESLKRYYSKLHRQKGYRNVFVGRQQRAWLDYIQERRAEKEEHRALNNSGTNNVSNNNLVNLKTLNTTSPEWIVAPGETVNTNIPTNLRPVRGTRRAKALRKGGKRIRVTRKH
jgi:hypothetical protein